MQSHEQRVVDEAAELADRLDKLAIFIDGSAIFQALQEVDQTLLVQQRYAMQMYLSILNLRIARF